MCTRYGMGVLYGMVRYGTVWYGTVRYGMVWYGMVWCGGMVWKLSGMSAVHTDAGPSWHPP